MDSRKLQKTGGSTMIVSLPKKWIDDSNLNQGSEVRIIPQPNGTLLIDAASSSVKTFSGSVTVVDNGPVDQVITLTESGLSSSSIEIATMEYLKVQNDLDLPVVISQTSGEHPFQSVKPNTQQKWNNPTYSLQSDYESIQSGSNITYTIYWLPEEKD